KIGERVVVGPAVPGLEVLTEGERRSVAVVAHKERIPQGASCLGLGLRRRERHLVGEEVVVHRDHAVAVAGERELEQRKAPESVDAPWPLAERRQAAGVVAEAVAPQHGIEGREVALEARRAVPGELPPAERELPAEEEREELVELAAPVRRGPVADAARPA